MLREGDSWGEPNTVSRSLSLALSLALSDMLITLLLLWSLSLTWPPAGAACLPRLRPADGVGAALKEQIRISGLACMQSSMEPCRIANQRSKDSPVPL